MCLLINMYIGRSKRKLVEGWIDKAFEDSIFISEERITVAEIKEEIEIDMTEDISEAELIVAAMRKYLKCMDKLGCKQVKYITDNQEQMNLNKDLMDRIDNFVEKYKAKMGEGFNIIREYADDSDFLLKSFKNLIETSYSYNKEFEDLFVECYKIKLFNGSGIVEDSTSSSDVAIGAMMTNKSKKKKQDDDIDEKLENEMKAYDLEEWQKDLVRKGEYDPWNFEEKNLEEEDYYSEDDD